MVGVTVGSASPFSRADSPLQLQTAPERGFARCFVQWNVIERGGGFFSSYVQLVADFGDIRDRSPFPFVAERCLSLKAGNAGLYTDIK